MLIGKLNSPSFSISYRVTKKDLDIVLSPVEGGNPFAGETLRFGWKSLIDSGIDIHISLPREVLLNTVVVSFAENTAPCCVSLFDREKRMLFSRYSAETGKHITESEVSLPVDETGTEFILEVCGDFTDIAIHSIALYGAIMEGPQIFPVPSQIHPGSGRVQVSSLLTCSTHCDTASRALPVLLEKYRDFTGICLSRIPHGDIALWEDGKIPKGGYRFNVGSSGVSLFASDLRGFVMGIETLCKLIHRGEIPVCSVEDAPFTDFRGVHLYLPAPEEIPFTKRLIKHILSPCGYNYIILEMGAGMRFDSHPEINAAFVEAAEKTRSGQWPALPHHEVAGGQLLEKDQVRDLVAYAREFGIEVIPEIQSLSHIQYLTQAYPEIAELPAEGTVARAADARLEDIPPSDFYAHSCCPSNPKTYQITFDLIDEIVDVVRPAEYVHMGHDEVYQIGICPLCRQEDPAELFARDVIKYHDYLATKGLKMMIWADMLQPIGENNQPKPTTRAVELLPRDIVLLDFIWYFHPNRDIEENLLPYGYQVIYGNLYSSHFPRYESRIRKAGIRGGQISAWVGTCEQNLAREGKLYDMLFTAQMLWSADYCHYNRYAYDRLIRNQIPALRSKLQDHGYPSAASGAIETVCFDAGPFLPDATETSVFPVGSTADSVIFRHTASKPCRRLPWAALDKIADYLLIYEDGTDVRIPVTYTGNIHHWNRRQNQPFPNMFYRHNGYTGVSWYCDSEESRLPDGRIVCIYQYEWINPHPERKIREIRLISAQAAETQVLVQSIITVTQNS